MEKFRMEIDALNAIYAEQKKMNDLLERLLAVKEPEVKVKKDVKHEGAGNRRGNH